MPNNKGFIINKTVDVALIALLLASTYTTAAWIDYVLYGALATMFIMMIVALLMMVGLTNSPQAKQKRVVFSTGWRGWSDLIFDVVFSLMLVMFVHFAIGFMWYGLTLIAKMLTKRHNARIGSAA